MSDLDPHILANYLFPVLIAFTALVVYVVGVRPMLRNTPLFKDVYDKEAGFLYSVNQKFGGVKQKITTIVLSAMGFIVLAHDQIAPLVTQAGVDPAQFLPSVPAYVWPLLTMAVLWLVQFFRNQADKAAQANAIALLNVGQPLAAPAPGLAINTAPSPLPVLGPAKVV